MTEYPLNTGVVICAYTENRWDIFVQAVESIIHQTRPPDEIIIVIDHNPQLLERTRQRFPAAVVTENKQTQGLSGARNTGIDVGHSRLIAFLDDDAVADPSWLETLTNALEDPNVLGVGSRVDPFWMVDRPGWFPDEFFWVVGCSYRGLPNQKSEVRNPTGGGMCLRREWLDKLGHFRIGIGRVGATPLGCEETELCIRARQAYPGHVFLFEPSTCIRHQITAPRATWGYFRSRCYAEGLSKALIAGLVGANDGLSSERSHVFKVLPLGVLKGLRDLVFHFDLGGAGRVVAIVGGTVITAIGYLVGTRSNSIHLIQKRIREEMVAAPNG